MSQGGDAGVAAWCRKIGDSRTSTALVCSRLPLPTGGHAAGYFESTGVRPLLLERLKAEGLELPPKMFQRAKLKSSAAD